MRMRKHVDEDVVYTARGSPLSVQHRPAPLVMRMSGAIECRRMCRSASTSSCFLSIFLSLGIFFACALLGPSCCPFEALCGPLGGSCGGSWGGLVEVLGRFWELFGRSCNSVTNPWLCLPLVPAFNRKCVVFLWRNTHLGAGYLLGTCSFSNRKKLFLF